MKNASNGTGSNSPTRVFYPGMVILDTYEVREALGRGGMGAVYRVYHRYLHKEMAMKTLLASSVSEHTWLRFQAEAKAIARLEHPNIIAIYDMGICEDGQPFYTMELLNGLSLDEWARRQPLTPVQALFVFRQVACALAFAHEHGVIHRDIKPANIVLTFATADKQPVVKVVDFGIAKLITESQGLTREGEVFGSPFYLSPEQASGVRVDPRSDIYSLGCALYEILTGFPPFKGKSAVETMTMHLDKVAVPIERARPDVNYPPGLSLLLQKCMAREPQARYKDALQLADDLLKIEQGSGEEVVARLEHENYNQGFTANSGLKRQVLSARPSVASRSHLVAGQDKDIEDESNLLLFDLPEEEDEGTQEVGRPAISGKMGLPMWAGLLLLALFFWGSYTSGAFSNLWQSAEEREKASCAKLYSEINHYRLTDADLQKLVLREPPKQDRQYFLFPLKEQELVGRIVLEPEFSDTHTTEYIEALGLVSVPRTRKGLALVLSHKLALNPRLLERFARDDLNWIELPANETAGLALNANLKNDMRRTNELLAKLYECGPAIDSINASNACLDEQSLIILSKFRHLERLYIYHAKLDNKESLAKLTNVRQFLALALPPCQDLSVILKQLAAAGKIQSLQLNKFEGNVRELDALSQLKSLKTFICRQSRLSPALIESLGTFPQLQVLNFSSCYLPEQARPVLMRMRKLCSLTLPRDIAQMWKTNVEKDFAGRPLFILRFWGLGMEWAPDKIMGAPKNSIEFDFREE